jgi:two-component sensor histidine kinase
METAVTCGLILNEIVSNALKHAFPDGRRGTIRISFEAKAEGPENGVPGRECTLVVADDGVGMPEGFEEERFGSLGLRLIRSLTGQLGGTLAVENDGGAKFTIRFRA